MALKSASELSATQWQIVHYARIASFGLGISVAAPVLVYALVPYTNGLRVLIAIGAAILSALAWFHFDKWCRRQILCPICRRTLMHLWVLEIWIGFWHWFGGVPDACPHCNARLP